MKTTVLSELNKFSPKIGIILICGCPASGKSTLCRNIVSCIYANTRTILPVWIDFDMEIGVIPYDTILLEKGSYKKLRENIHLKLEQLLCKILSIYEFDNSTNNLIKMINQFFPQSVYTNFGNSENMIESILILLDDTFHYKSMRYKFYRISTKYNIGFLQVYVDCSMDLLLSRNFNRHSLSNVNNHGKENTLIIQNDDIIRLSDIFEIPTPDNHWGCPSITIASQFINDNLIFDLITKLQAICVHGQLPSLDVKQVENIQPFSLLHEIDCILRSIVSQKIKESCDKKQGAFINSLKNEFFNNLKNDQAQICHLGELWEQSAKQCRSYVTSMIRSFVLY